MAAEGNMTTTAEDTDRSARARAIWDDYQRTHDLTAFQDFVAAVNMDSGEVHIVPSPAGLPGGPDDHGRVPAYFVFGIGRPYLGPHGGRPGRRLP